jgi:TPR repeat protein
VTGGRPADAANRRLYNACKAGDGSSCSKLARNYTVGAGVSQDSQRALVLLRRGCDANDAWACAELGDTYRLGLLDVRVSDRRAAPYYRRACDLGSSTGCRNVAINYALGRTVRANIGQAATYRRRACDLGDLTSCEKMGYYSYAGLGVPRLAFRKWVRRERLKASGRYVRSDLRQTARASCHQLAVLHRSGRGVRRSEQTAGVYLERGCEYGEANACIQRAEQLIIGRGVPRDHARAVTLLRTTCERHKGAACRVLRPYEKTYEPRLDRTRLAWQQLHAALDRLAATPEGADLDDALWKFGASLSRINKESVDIELSKHIHGWDEWATALRRLIRTGSASSSNLEILGMLGGAMANDPEAGTRRGAEIGAALDALASTIVGDGSASQLARNVEALRREQVVLRMRLALRYSVAF